MKNMRKLSFGLVFSVLLLGILSPLFTPYAIENDNGSYKLAANDSFIEILVFNETSDPIQGANINLMDDMWNLVDSGITDIDGFYNFTGLSVGDFFLDISYLGFEPPPIEMYTLDFDGDAEYLVFYLAAIYQSGTGFIEVTVYDTETLLAIPNAAVALLNENYYNIDFLFADINGFCNFTHLGPGIYVVEAVATGYNFNETFVEIDYDGEAEQVDLYIPEAYVPGIGYIEVFVYDFNTLLPIIGATVRLYDEYYYDIDMGFTDGSGYYNFTGLGVGDYIVEASAATYVTQSNATYISFDGEGQHVEIYPYKTVKTFDILTPTASQTVEGGSVLVEYTASEPTGLDTIDVYVNAVLITTIGVHGGPYTEFIVPVFANGTNTIYLEGHWNDATIASDTVDINSINVIPIVKIREDDILNYRQLDLINVETYDFNFTFTTWLSTFVMLTKFDLHHYNATGTIVQDQYWLHINVLNGYVSSDTSGMMLLYNHFFPFGSFLPSPVVGDKTVWVPWGQMMIAINGSTTWDYTDVWTATESSGMMLVYYEKSTNLMCYLEQGSFVEAYLLITTIDFLNPEVFDLSDFAYTEGTTGNTISWAATDMNPWMYTISNNTVLLETGYWTSDINITINIDGLSPGTYDYRIVITDARGNIVEDTLTVTVNVAVNEINPMLCIIFAPISIFVTYVILRKRKN